MGIEIRDRPPEARLYDAIAQEAAKLSLGDRMALFAAMKQGRPFRELDEHLQRAFRNACELMRRGGGV